MHTNFDMLNLRRLSRIFATTLTLVASVTGHATNTNIDCTDAYRLRYAVRLAGQPKWIAVDQDVLLRLPGTNVGSDGPVKLILNLRRMDGETLFAEFSFKTHTFATAVAATIQMKQDDPKPVFSEFSHPDSPAIWSIHIAPLCQAV